MRIFMIAALLVVATPALAGPHCTDDPKSAWLSEAQMMQQIALLGHQVDIFKVTDGNCYEIYGRNMEGKRVEVYFHPVTGEVVKASSL